MAIHERDDSQELLNEWVISSEPPGDHQYNNSSKNALTQQVAI